MKENKTALMKAADLLARQDQSSKVLRRKLLQRKYSEQETDAAIKTLQERKFLDDDEICKRQFEILYSEERLSVKQICIKLIQRGFDSEFVKNLIPADYEEREIKIAQRLLEKNFSAENFDELSAQDKFKLKTKMYQKLSARGLSSEIISSAIENFSCKIN